MWLQIKQLYIDKRTNVWTITCQRLTTKAVKYALKGHGFGEIWNISKYKIEYLWQKFILQQLTTIKQIWQTIANNNHFITL